MTSYAGRIARRRAEISGPIKKEKSTGGWVEKKVYRVETRGENRVTFDLEGNLGFSISDE